MSEIKFGSDEWFIKLNQMIDFPEKFVFYFNKEDNIIQVSRLDSKGKIENARWSAVRPTPLSFHPIGKTAVIDIKEIQTAEEYYEVSKDFKDTWCS